MDNARFPKPSAALMGPWPDGPWWLLGGASLAAPCAVLLQGGSPHLAAVAALACLATPGAAIEAMSGLARLALSVIPPQR
ncbi:hypothetical protein [Paracraurococcus ruber]|uniref:hypothetical protein n=1 Tax=Paracraurococcus ruber TaxID=77675 RepID=UPI001058224F|nr:hypothetical protein [Paracraurococcus ruber]